MQITPCGIECGKCPMYGQCGGCTETKGKPFFLKEAGAEVCPLYDCPVNEKGFKTCAECSELPCGKFYDWRDPEVPEEAHGENIRKQMETLRGLRQG